MGGVRTEKGLEMWGTALPEGAKGVGLVQWVKPPQLSHVRALVLVPTAWLLILLPAHVPEKPSEDGPRAWTSAATRMGYPIWSPRFLLRLSPTLTIVGIYRMNQ